MAGVTGSSPVSPTTLHTKGAHHRRGNALPPPFFRSDFAYTHLLRLRDGSLYVGSTPDLRYRIDQHKAGCGGRTTRLQSGELIYYEACRSLPEARKREKQLKTGYGRAYLKRRLAFDLGGSD